MQIERIERDFKTFIENAQAKNEEQLAKLKEKD